MSWSLDGDMEVGDRGETEGRQRGNGRGAGGGEHQTAGQAGRHGGLHLLPDSEQKAAEASGCPRWPSCPGGIALSSCHPVLTAPQARSWGTGQLRAAASEGLPAMLLWHLSQLLLASHMLIFERGLPGHVSWGRIVSMSPALGKKHIPNG